MRNFGASATTMRSRDVALIAGWPRQVTRCPGPPPVEGAARVGPDLNWFGVDRGRSWSNAGAPPRARLRLLCRLDQVSEHLVRRTQPSSREPPATPTSARPSGSA